MPRPGVASACATCDGRPMIVPFRELSAAALAGVLREFVLREGTDYGHADIDIDDKVAAVRRQLERGEAVIVFDADSGSVDIRPV